MGERGGEDVGLPAWETACGKRVKANLSESQVWGSATDPSCGRDKNLLVDRLWPTGYSLETPDPEGIYTYFL